MSYSWDIVIKANQHGTIEDLNLALIAAFEDSEEAYSISSLLHVQLRR